MKETYSIYELTNNPIADTMELGDVVYKQLKPKVEACILENKDFVIDFKGITSLTTKFLNNAIGNLIINRDEKKILKLMTFSGLDMAKKETLRWSLAIALKTLEANNKRKNN